MMKRLILCLLMAVLVVGTVSAESIVDTNYVDVTTVMTHDSVAELLASEECLIQTFQPDQEAADLLHGVYEFVWEDKNRPARYYEEEVQQEIAALAGGDIDQLHLTEIMYLNLTGMPETTVTATMRLDVEYYVGQLVIVVLGIPQENGEYEWHTYLGRVETLGEIKWDIPAEDWAVLSQQPITFQVLTDRVGPRGGLIWGYEEYEEHLPPAFSKEGSDVNGIHWWYSQWDEKIDDNFDVHLEELTDPMQAEVARIGEHVAAGKAILDYFPQACKDEALLMLPEDVAASELIVYDVIAMSSKEYKDTYGDVNVEVVFGTVYHPEKAMVILAGFPIEDATEPPYVEWYVLRAKALEPQVGQVHTETVEVSLKQLIFPQMQEEKLMLVVISEPLETE